MSQAVRPLVTRLDGSDEEDGAIDDDWGGGRTTLVVAGLSFGLLATLTLAVMIGSVPIPPGRVWQIILHHILPGLFDGDWPISQDQIVWQIRLPRVLLGAFVGASLAVVGATLQAIVRNPLADPYVFGITSGASVGAVVVILFGITTFGVYSLSAAAFLGALMALVLVYGLAQRAGQLSPIRLILAGVAISYVLSAITSFIIFQSDTAASGALRAVLFWLLGGLGGARWSYLALPAACVGAGTFYLVLHARHLNALLFGDETAMSLGIDANRLRKRLFTLTALLTGVTVAVSGGIGFVGLMMPHIVRLLVGSDHRRVLPVSALLGAIFLIWVDVLARTLVAPEELPIGIITALTGGPFFVWLLRRRQSGELVGGTR